MAEDTTVPQAEQDAPASSPAPSQDEIRQMVEAEAQRIVDARIPGLQSAYEKQIAALRKELKAAQEDPAGYTTDADSEIRAELERARREADALRAGRQYPEAFPVYEALMAAGTAEEQLELLQSFVRGNPSDAPTPAPQPEAGSTPAPEAPAAPPPVDRNNPPQEQAPYTGAGFTDVSQAERFLSQFKTWPKFRG